MGSLRVLAGRNLISKDPNGLSDPYCVIGVAEEGASSIDNPIVTSEVKFWTLHPSWQRAVVKDPVEGSTLRIEVWDKDADEPEKPDDFMGYALYKIQEPEDKWITLLPRDASEPVSGEIRVILTLDKAISNHTDIGTPGTSDVAPPPPHQVVGYQLARSDTPTQVINDDSFAPSTRDVPTSATNGITHAGTSSTPPSDAEESAYIAPASSLSDEALQLVKQFTSTFLSFMSFVVTNADAFESLVERLGRVAYDWLEISKARVLESSAPASETRGQSLPGLGRLCKGQWIEGFKFYNAHQKANSDKGAAYAYIMCRLLAPLGNCPKALLKELEEIDATLPSSSTTESRNSDASALRLITYACVYDKCVSKSGGPNPNQLRAGAYALSFLASPSHWREHLGGALEAIGERILREHCGELAFFFGVCKATQQPILAPKATISDKWQLRKSSSLPSAALDQLLALAGIDDIKRQVLEIYDQVCLDTERKFDLNSQKYNVKFIGNPGTGKTTVARLYADMLKELNVIPGGIQETTGAKLAEAGVNHLVGIVDKIQNGGLLFVDRAEALDPEKACPKIVSQVLETIITFMDNPKLKLVVVFAGFPKPIEKLFTANEGLPSRFPFTFTFPDFTDDQIFTIYCSFVKEANYTFINNDPKYVRVLSHRLGRRRGTNGFGNARAVGNAFQEARRRQACRLVDLKYKNKLQPSMMRVLERDDILGPIPGDLRETSEAWHKLEKMVGLSKVKSAIQGMFSLAKNNMELEEEEQPVNLVALNRLFLGNPGTGKTTVAALYGRILKDLGLLSIGDVKQHTASDFISVLTGGSEENTRRIIKAAEGCVLVIDEAYGLYPGKQGNADINRTAVLNTIVEEIQNIPGEDRCVIMLGYEEQMREMIRDSNPGLARRFQLDDALMFEDYNNYELLQILDMRIERDGVLTSQEARIAALTVLERLRSQPNFGNGGAVANLTSQAILRMRERTKDQKRSQELLPNDFDPTFGQAEDEDVFAGLLGCENIIRTLREYRATIMMGKEKGQQAFENEKLDLNFLFVGPPGTGKTTVARRMGKMFKSLGVLTSDDVTSISASDLETGFMGQSSKKARDVMTSSIGRVLFIDEAYRLATDTYLQQAADEIVQMLTEPKFKGKIVVILAGYEHQMDNLMKLNPGLRSRFSTKIKFENFSSELCCNLLKQHLKKDGLEMDESISAKLPPLVLKLSSIDDFANGRDIDNWANRIYRTVASRRFDNPDVAMTVLIEDLEASLDSMIQDRLTHTADDDDEEADEMRNFEGAQCEVASASQTASRSETKRAPQKQKNAARAKPDTEGSAVDKLTNLSSAEWAKLHAALAKEGRSLDEGIAKLSKDTHLVYKLAKSLGSIREVHDCFKRAANELENAKSATAEDEDEEAQQILSQMGNCVMGFKWLRVEGGYRCAGGSHFVTHEEISKYRKR